MSAKRVSIAERRARLGVKHRLANIGLAEHGSETVKSGAVETLADDLVALHASDPATIFLSVAARLANSTPADVEAALFERRTVLRTLAMRRTLFVVTTTTAPMVEVSSSIGVAAAERRRLEQFLAESSVADPPGWMADTVAEVMEALDTAGPDGLSAKELTKLAPRLGTRFVMGAGTKHAVEAGATSRVLGVMAVDGLLVRGRPSGDWTGRQYRWHRRDRWWPRAEQPVDESLGEDEASSQLLRRWLDRFGPATIADMKWWTGWTVKKTRAALAGLETIEVVLDETDGAAGYLLAEDAESVATVEPWAALLPSLDPTPMGWKERSWYLGGHKAELFDRNGNIGPTVWVDGRIVGGWSQNPDGEVVVQVLEPVGADHQALIDTAVARTAAFLGEVVVRPSFPTPLQKHLSAGRTDRIQLVTER